jgi:putative ABC transport system permease protein
MIGRSAGGSSLAPLAACALNPLSGPQQKLSFEPRSGIGLLSGTEGRGENPIFGGITSLPLQGNSIFSPFRIQGRPTGPDGKLMAAVINVVSPGYFNTMGIPLRSGRWFSDNDAEQSQRVAVINDVAAKKFFEGSDPIGQQVFIRTQGDQPYRVVGVVGSTRQFDITSEPNPEIFTNYQQSTMN